MFHLAILKDTIGIHPSNFGIPPETALIAELNKKYANRVLHDVGLCVCVFDLTEAGEGKVRYGDGFLYYKVVFRLVVFRPFTSEVILAKVKSSDAESIRLTMGFFDDIYIPSIYLPQPSAFDPNERAFFWVPESELTTSSQLLDTDVGSRMYIDAGEVVRVRVEADEFHDDEPGPPKMSEGVQVKQEPRRAPYQIICSIAESGLGNVSWWNSSQEEDAEGDVVMEE
ncbi:RNA polymerase III subunit Rpc25-domain-containing protein [Desarmillaria tabescens]|uniref:RNA polymerase III subunit Rpc25-domain-containing protein n=1 Tax=Armillaria tabescens TaxID=1929756 RepID=A0AA39JYQ7_ARMTA|nr:RNA polymerase III subunit Rpc25-domain-containing protein [Desarmillaria tabescens]KAK0451390.1 RNA polymerase III subunit Rpc25-domain-containing protein [Desarmillaria tabescens]